MRARIDAKGDRSRRARTEEILNPRNTFALALSLAFAWVCLVPVCVSGVAARAEALPLHEQVLNVGESSYPQFFPGKKATATVAPFRFRYYPETGIYLGVVVGAATGLAANGVYVMGGPFGTDPRFVGLATDFVTLCAETRTDELNAQAPRCHDLDGDGVPDSSVTFSGGRLVIRGLIDRDYEIDADSSAALMQVAAIGNHVGGPLSELAVRLEDANSSGNRARVMVFDLEQSSAAPIAITTQPLRTPTRAIVVMPRLADGRRTAVLVPSQEQSNATWSYLCKFEAGRSDPTCGTGFTRVEARPPAPITGARIHQGAWVQDADGDGTDDLHLRFYSARTGDRHDGGVLTVSMTDGRTTWTRLTMAEQTRDAEELFGTVATPAWSALAGMNAQGFDSGRLYGTASAFQDGEREKVLLVGGNPVGKFASGTTSIAEAPKVMCNVTRYVALLDHARGHPDARRVEWGWYFGFYQDVFQTQPIATVPTGEGALLKRAYMAHGCIHRYGNARVTSNQGARAAIFNVFRVLAPEQQRSCEDELRAAAKSRFETTANDKYLSCVIANAASMGRWEIQMLDEITGAKVAKMEDAYLWGYTDRLLPGGRQAMLVESLGAPVTFYRASVPASIIKVLTIDSDGGWRISETAASPVGGVPALRDDDYDVNPPLERQSTTGDLVHLVTRPNQEAAGLVDVLLRGGVWIGYSPAQGKLSVKR